MAKAWIVDLWVKDATAAMPDGSTVKISPTREQMRSVKTLPEHFRTSRWMKGKRWRVAWHEDTANGQVQRAKLFAGKQEAEEFASELEDDIRMGRYIDPRARERHFGEIAEEWFATKRKIKDSTWLLYRRQLDNHILPKWGAVPIGSITRRAVEEWVTQLSEGTAPSTFKGKDEPSKLSPSSVELAASAVFGSAIRYAISMRIITDNPTSGVELPRTQGDEVKDLPILTMSEVEELALEALAAARTDGRRKDNTRASVGDDTLVRLLAYCGLRVNEALALKVGDLDLESKRAQVRRTWTKTKTGARKLGPPKTWERRAIPIPTFLVPELQTLVEGMPSGAFLFRTERGHAIDHKNWYNRVWRKAIPGMGLTIDLTIHDLRHTAASIAIASGADVKLVQTMLGHKDATETLNTYSHLWPDRLDEVMDAMTEYRAAALKLAA